MSFLQHRRIIYTSLAIILLAANIGAYYFSVRSVNNFVNTRLEFAAQDLKNTINSRIASYSNTLYGVRALFAVDGLVTPAEFHTYIADTEIFSRLPGVDVMGYVPIVAPEQRGEFERYANGLGFEGYQIYPAQPTDLIAPVLYLEPYNEDQKAALGYNIFSEKQRKTALEYAIDHDSLVITNRIVAARDQKSKLDRPSIIVYLPIFRKGAENTTTEQRRANITGFVSAVIYPDQLLKGITLQAIPGVKYQVFDDSYGSDLTSASLLYNSGPPELLMPGAYSNFTELAEIEWPNTKWHLRFVMVPDNNFARILQLAPYLITLMALILSVLIFFAIMKMLDAYQRLRLTTSAFSERLIAEDSVVDAYPEGIIATDTKGLITVFNKKAEQILGYLEPEVISIKKLMDLVEPESLQRYIAEVSKEQNNQIVADFGGLITRSLIEGQDIINIGFLSKTGRVLAMTVAVRPLYSDANQPLGYQFTFK